MPKPKTILCYICGRDFGPHSINVHERQCAKRWEAAKKKQREIENEKDARKRKTSRERSSLDPWRGDPLPSFRGHENITRSMHDIRTPSKSEPLVTASEKDLMRIFRPQTVTLQGDRKTDNVNRQEGNENGELNHDGHKMPHLEVTGEDIGDADDVADVSSCSDDSKSSAPDRLETVPDEKLSDTEKPAEKPLRPGTATLRKHMPATVLPNRVSAKDFMKKGGAKSASPVNHTLDPRPGTVTLRKHSAPEAMTPSMLVSRNSSPTSSTSSDSQDPVGSQANPDHPNISTPRFRSSKNPNMLVCYICGNEYGSRSLKIHEPQCLKKWKLANPRYYSRKGSSGGMYKANSVHAINSTPSSSKPLKQTTEAKRHVTSGKAASCENLLNVSREEGGSLQALKELSRSHGRLHVTPPRKPQMVPCYICGREFIKHSLQVHEKQCLKKWDAAKGKKEKAEKEKKKLAKTQGAPTKRHSITLPVAIKINKAEDFENNNLENNNPNTDRKTDDKPGTTVDVENTPKTRKPTSVTCYICGRAYGTASISIHEKQCQKKWEAQEAKKEEEERLAKKTKRKPRPQSFVL